MGAGDPGGLRSAASNADTSALMRLIQGEVERVSAPRARRSVHVHVENSKRSDPVFRVTPEVFAAAAARHPDVAARVTATFGEDLADFDRVMQTAEAMIGWRLPTERFRERAPRLRWVHLKGAGVEHLRPLDWLPADLVLTNNRGVHAPKAGEFAATALLLLNARIPELLAQQREHRWRQLFSTPIAGKTVLIVGVGAMGGAAARRARALGLRVVGVRRSGRRHAAVHEMHRPARLDALLPRADFLLVTVPLTDATRHLIGRPQLDRLRPEAGLVNMARAGVVDYPALAQKLRAGQLAGAVLDVFDPEPLPADSPLWDTPRLVMTPHVSSDDAERYTPLTLDLFFGNLRRYLAGRPLKNRVDPRREY
jgi:phosphoglycerate dehydrogenase-like enzyme